MNKKLTLILALLILAVVSVSLVTAVNDTSDSIAADDSPDDVISADDDIQDDGDDDKLAADDDDKKSTDSNDDKVSEGSDDVKQVNSFEIKKIWDDNNDKQGKRPKSVSVSVTINNDPRDPYVLNEENGWKTTVTDVDDGSSIEIKEETVDGYTSKVEGNFEKGYTITNTLDDQDQNSTDPKDPDEPTGDGDNSKDTTKVKETKVITKTTTKEVPVKQAKKDTNKTKDKHDTGNPILLGILALSAAGLAIQLRRKE